MAHLHIASICGFAFVLLLSLKCFSLLKRQGRRWLTTWYLQQRVDHHFGTSMPFQISYEDRQRHDRIYDPHLIYGALTVHGAYRLAESMQAAKGMPCVDLGSGNGQALFMLASLLKSPKGIGVESVAPLWRESVRIARHINSPLLTFLCHDFKDFVPPLEPCMVLLNASGYFGQECAAVSKVMTRFASGSFICVISQRLHSQDFHLRVTTQIETSWGFATARCYQKIQ